MGDTDCYRKYLHRFRLDDCSKCPGCGDVPEDTDIPVSEIRKHKPGAEDDVEPKVTQEKKLLKEPWRRRAEKTKICWRI